MPSLLFTKHEARSIQPGNHNLRLKIQSIPKMRASKTFYVERNSFCSFPDGQAYLNYFPISVVEGIRYHSDRLQEFTLPSGHKMV